MLAKGWEVLEGSCTNDDNCCLRSPNHPHTYPDGGSCRVKVGSDPGPIEQNHLLLCFVKDCPGHTLRKMKPKATGEIVTERITIDEEIGMITYNKCDANGSPGDVNGFLPFTLLSTLSSSSALPAAAFALIGRRPTAWQAIPSQTSCSWRGRLRRAAAM